MNIKSEGFSIMIDKKYQRVLFALIMAFLMSGIMSLSINILNIGLVEGLVSIRLRTWFFAFGVAFPVVMIVSPSITVLMKLLIKKDV